MLSRYSEIFGLINCVVIITNTVSIKVCTKQFAALETFTQLNCLLTSKYSEDVSKQDVTSAAWDTRTNYDSF